MRAVEGLIEFIKKKGPVAVAFSGGVDSSVVAAAAYRAHGARSLAVTVSSELFPEADAMEAAKVAEAIGIPHEIVRLSVLGNESVASNPPDRCYHCKSDDFSAIRRAAQARGLRVVMDGTNADDPKGHRPGLKALGEMGVVSPLLELGIGKARVREIAREFNLPNSEKPSSPCLASRFPYGCRLTLEKLERVRAAEEYIRGLGLGALRVRDHDGLARIEVEPADIPKLSSADTQKKIVAMLRSLGYNYVTLDLEGFRSGSMDIFPKP